MDLELRSAVDAAGQAVVTLSGSLDLESRSELTAAAGELLKAGPVRLVLDLADVTFIDSTGIGAIVDISHSADELGVTFSLARPSSRVLRILEITGLSQEWAIDGSANSA
jgi:anti-sigma B factor antagonist